MAGSPKRRRSLSRRLTSTVVLVSSIITTIIVGLEMWLLYRDESDSIMRSMTTAAVTVSPLMTEAVWNLDKVAMKKVAEGIAINEGVLKVTVRNTKGEQVYQYIVDVPDTKRETDTTTAPMAYAAGTKQLRKIGTIEVLYSKDAAIAKVRLNLLRTVAMNIVKTVLVASILMFLFNRMLIKPIMGAVGYFRENDANDPQPERIQVDRNGEIGEAKSQDEIDELLRAILKRETLLEDYINKSKKTITQQGKSLKESKKAIDTQAAQLAEADEQIKFERAKAMEAARLAQMGEMASGISHEINNPLTVIMGYQFKLKSMAKSGKFDPEKFQTYIENCEAMTGRISRIVRSLRDFARDADTDSIASIGVLKIIEDVYVLTQHRLSENGIQFRVVKPQDDFNLECRFAQVEQVIVSIINNAHEAIAPITGEKWIEFQASQSNDKCVFMVTDCGGGIPADVVDKIFSPFFTTKKASNASGLGLSTSYGIIQNHGGQIFVDRKCANTRFVIELPLAAPKTADPPASVQTPAA